MVLHWDDIRGKWLRCTTTQNQLENYFLRQVTNLRGFSWKDVPFNFFIKMTSMSFETFWDDNHLLIVQEHNTHWNHTMGQGQKTLLLASHFLNELFCKLIVRTINVNGISWQEFIQTLVRSQREVVAHIQLWLFTLKFKNITMVKLFRHSKFQQASQ